MKKLLIGILTLVLLIACVCALSSQTNAATISSGTCGDNLTWTLDNAGTLTISGTGKMTDYWTGVANPPWYDRRANIKNVAIGDRVTYIGDEAFFNCVNLTSITIPESVTTIGDRVFDRCSSLTSIAIPNNITSIGWTFYGCDSLTYNIYDNGKYLGNNTNPYVVLVDVTSTSISTCKIHPATKLIGDCAFNFCTNLTSVTIPDRVTSIGDEAFYDCDSLTSITIGDGITFIGEEAFYGCYSMNDVYITDPNAWCKVQFVDNPLNYLLYDEPDQLHILDEAGSEITELVLDNTVTTIPDYAFYKCESLTSVTIGDNVTSIGECAFYYCTDLANLTIGDNVTTIGNNAFWVCVNLTSVKFGDRVTTIGDDAFKLCTNLTLVTIPDSVTSISDSAFSFCYSLSNDDKGVLFNKDKTILIAVPGGISGSYTVPDSVLTIMGGFSGRNNLTSVTLGSGVTSIGEYEFSECANLTSVTIPKSITSIGEGAFDGCNSLKNVYYAADSAKWNRINIGEDNEDLTNATIHYNHIHDYSLFAPITEPANCAKAGYIEYTCAFGETHREILPALPHDYTSGEKVVAPTCTEEGYTCTLCAQCGNVKDKHSFVPAAGHKMVLVPAVAPGCTNPGLTAGTQCEHCQLVGVAQRPVTPLGHNMVESIAVKPTCTEPGLTAGSHCERCQMVGIAQTEVPATGHSFADGVCTACGEPECTPGDLTSDGNINSLDGLLLMRYLNGWDVNIAAEAAMDVNGDGNVNSLDGLMLMRYLNGWDVTLG